MTYQAYQAGLDDVRVASGPIREALTLQEEILRHIPATALKLRPQPYENSAVSSSQGPLEFACSFYGIENPFHDPIQRINADKPFVTNFEDLISLTTTVTTSLRNCAPELSQPLRVTFAQSILLVMRLLGRMDQKLDAPFDVDWDPSEWLSSVLESVELPVRKTPWDLLCAKFHSGISD